MRGAAARSSSSVAVRHAQATAASRDAEAERAEPLGLGFVAAVSFLASRAAPSGGFFVALAGGTALARAGQRLGARLGYGVSIASMLESVAIMGPARFGVPLTQAMTAPMIGRLEARGVHAALQVVACGAIRTLQNAVGTAFFIWVILGLDAYAGSYDALLGELPVIPEGQAAALVATVIGILAWTVFASTLQVQVYRRGLRRWPAGVLGGGSVDADGGSGSACADHGPAGGAARNPEAAAALPGPGRDGRPGVPAAGAPRRFDPRAAALAAALAFGLLIASTEWPLLGAVAAWLALAWASARGDAGVVPTGLLLAGLLAGGTLAFGLVGGLGADLALRRAVRAALLVLVATWLRAAAGSEGLRDVARRSLGRLRRVPSVPEAVVVLDRLGSDRRLLAAGRDLLDALAPARKRPLPVVDAVLGWVAGQAQRFRPQAPAPALRLGARPADALLIGLAALTAATLPAA